MTSTSRAVDPRPSAVQDPFQAELRGAQVRALARAPGWECGENVGKMMEDLEKQ